MLEGFLDTLRRKRHRDTRGMREVASKPPADEQKLKEKAELLTQALRKKKYCSLIGSLEDATAVVDQVISNLQEDSLILRVSASPEIREAVQVLEAFSSIAPEASHQAVKSRLGTIQNFSELFKAIVAGSERPVLAVLENLQDIEGGECADLVRTVRSLYTARRPKGDLGNLTFLLTGNKSPSDFLPQDGVTPYNIGETFFIGE